MNERGDMMAMKSLSPAAPSEDCASQTDRELLARFVTRCDETAFEMLVQRYGPMVLGVCRRILGDATDAEDAFQATFLVLVRKARTIARPDLLGNWLYGVAYRIARKARAQRTKRAQQKQPLAPMTSPDPTMEAALHELQAQLDEELEKLPTKYRAPLVLCYLEGMSNREAAQRLGWPIGSISHRLARGRQILRQRLQDRHPSASYLVLGALPIWAVASKEALARVQELATRAALRLAENETTDGFLSPTVRALYNQTLKEMAVRQRNRVVLLVVGAILALLALTLGGFSVAEAVSLSSTGSTPAGASCHGGATGSP
jgi:RNA polymerase sigma factor (sigma-70 family)